MIQQAIEAFREKRISDLEYLNKVVDIKNKVVGKVHDDIPQSLAGNEDAMAYYGVLKPLIGEAASRDTWAASSLKFIAADTALAINKILQQQQKIHFWDDEDAQNQTVNEIENYLLDEVGLDFKIVDQILEQIMQVAEHRSRR
ncbi:MAG: hypothetical protein D3903_15700 [Candidatus Electrothrix sp. GM3_4]|nr:hypothetical protein [Candidatus Electrothrix sp. GM3_4]